MAVPSAAARAKPTRPGGAALSILDLPVDLLLGVFSKLSFLDKLWVGRACRAWQCLLESPQVAPSAAAWPAQ